MCPQERRGAHRSYPPLRLLIGDPLSTAYTGVRIVAKMGLKFACLTQGGRYEPISFCRIHIYVGVSSYVILPTMDSYIFFFLGYCGALAAWRAVSWGDRSRGGDGSRDGDGMTIDMNEKGYRPDHAARRYSILNNSNGGARATPTLYAAPSVVNCSCCCSCIWVLSPTSWHRGTVAITEL